MSKWNPFSDTYTVKCCDNTNKIVHKKIETAFPLALSSFDAKASIGVTSEFIEEAKASGSLKTQIEGLLFQLDEFNNSLMMKFRAAYVGYQSDPCSNNQYFLSRIEIISEREEFFTMLKMQGKLFIELAKNSPDNSELITEKYNELISKFNSEYLNSSEASKAIEASKKALGKMKENDE